MINWLRSLGIAGGVLLGSLGNIQGQSVDGSVLNSLKGDWKEYPVQANELPVRSKPKEQPLVCSNKTDSAFMDFLERDWKGYETQINEQPAYNSEDSVKNYELPSFREAKKKLGIDYVTELKSLGYGYVTSKPEYSSLGEGTNYNELKKISALRNGSLKLNYNGRKGFLEGKSIGEPSEKTLDNVDADDDHIITDDEISNAMKLEYQKAFLKYASKELGVPESEIVFVDKNHVTSRDLENRLSKISESYETHFEKPRGTLYNCMGKDAVLTEDEISKTEKVLSKYL